MNERILNILEEICEEDTLHTDLDCDLFENDLLDSLSFAEFLAELEEQLGIVISPSSIQREAFNTPRKILEFLAARS